MGRIGVVASVEVEAFPFHPSSLSVLLGSLEVVSGDTGVLEVTLGYGRLQLINSKGYRVLLSWQMQREAGGINDALQLTLSSLSSYCIF